MLNVVFSYCYAKCHNAECRYAEYHYAECHYAECHDAECRGALLREWRIIIRAIVTFNVNPKELTYHHNNREGTFW